MGSEPVEYLPPEDGHAEKDRRHRLKRHASRACIDVHKLLLFLRFLRGGNAASI